MAINLEAQNGIKSEVNNPEAQFDPFVTPTITVNKLDADQYAAEDIDGVTESLFGSGNMNFLVLQSGQTDKAMAANDPFSLNGTDNILESNVNPASFASIGQNNIDFDFQPNGSGRPSSDITTDTDRTLEASQEAGETGPAGGNFSNTTIGSLGASTLASDAGTFNNIAGGFQDASALNAVNGLNGNDGNNGMDGETPDIPAGDNGNTLIDIDVIFDLDLGDTVSNAGDILVDIGDLVIDLTTTVTQITDILQEIVNEIDLGDIINLGDITEVIHNLTDILNETLTQTFTELTELTNNLTEILTDVLGPDGLNLDLNILDIIKANLSASLTETLNLNLNTDIDLTPITDLVDKLADLTNLDALSNTVDLLNQTTENLETTLNNLSDALLDVTQAEDLGDALEDLGNTVNAITDGVNDTLGGVLDGLGLGGNTNNNDTDLTIDLADGLIDTSFVEDLTTPLLNPVEDLVGDIDVNLDGDIDLLGLSGNETDNDAGDTDLSLGVVGDLVGNDLIGNTLDIELDPVEEITGDIDLDLDTAVNALGDLADPLVNDDEGGTGDDTLLSGLGDALGDTVDTILPDANNDDGTDSDVDADLGVAALDNDVVDTGDVDVILDPVEGIAGDVDTDLGLDTDLLGTQDNASGDSDIDLDLDIDLLGTDIVDVDEDIPLDPVEEITGDIDLDVDSALNLLNTDNQSSDPLSTAVDEISDWTESTTDRVTGLFDDIIGGLGGETDVLSEPSGTVAEGIGALDVNPDAITGALGGLFG